MLKRFFSKYKIELLEAYLAASVWFFFSSMEWTWISIAVVIGFVNTYLLNPLIITFKFGNRSDYMMFKKSYIRAFKNIGMALLICSIIVLLYGVVNKYLFATSVEPITFGILFKLIDMGLKRLYNYIMKLK